MTREVKVVWMHRLRLRLIRTVFLAKTPSPRPLDETVERNTQNSPRRAKLQNSSATELADRAFPSRPCPHLSPPPISLPAVQSVAWIPWSDRIFRPENLTGMSENRQEKDK